MRNKEKSNFWHYLVDHYPCRILLGEKCFEGTLRHLMQKSSIASED